MLKSNIGGTGWETTIIEKLDKKNQRVDWISSLPEHSTTLVALAWTVEPCKGCDGENILRHFSKKSLFIQ